MHSQHQVSGTKKQQAKPWEPTSTQQQQRRWLGPPSRRPTQAVHQCSVAPWSDRPRSNTIDRGLKSAIVPKTAAKKREDDATMGQARPRAERRVTRAQRDRGGEVKFELNFETADGRGDEDDERGSEDSIGLPGAR